MSTIESLLEKIDTSKKDSVAEVLAEAFNDGGVSVGTTVACLDNNIYPFDGVRGKVKSINNGYALVEFPNGAAANMLINLLVPVNA